MVADGKGLVPQTLSPSNSEGAPAPAPQDASRKNIGDIRPTSNAAERDAGVAEYPSDLGFAALVRAQVGWLPYSVFFLMIFLNSEIFFLTGWKRTGFQFFREAFLLGLCVYCVLFFLVPALLTLKCKRSDLVVAAVILYLTILPAVNAKLMYGQPLIYGLLEERRVLHYLIYFPIVFFLRRFWLNDRDLNRIIILSAIGCIALSVLYSCHIIPENARPSYAVESREYGVGDPRFATRFPIGGYYIFWAYVYALVRILGSYSQAATRGWLVLLAATLGYVVLIDQGRLMLAMFLFAGLLVIWKSKRSPRGVLLVGLCAVSLMAVTSTSLWDYMQDRITFMISNTMVDPEEHVRFNTIATILAELRESRLIGHGSLSLQWNDGFHRVYGPHFYLSDVGLFGTIFRQGAPVLFFLPLFYMFLKRAAGRIVDGKLALTACVVVVSYMIFGVISAKIEYAGSILGIVLALSSSSRAGGEQR